MSADVFPEDEVRRILERITDGIPMVFADQDGERPALPYVTFRANLNGGSGLPHESKPDEDGFAVFRGVVPVTIELVAYYDRANALVGRIAQRLSLPRVRSELAAVKCVPAEILSMSNATVAVDDASFETRWIFEFVLNWTEEVREEVGIIEDVEFQCPEYTGEHQLSI